MAGAMPTIRCTHVEVYVFRRRASRVEFLALRRSVGSSLAGIWQPVTGKIDRGETMLDAAVREVREETGLLPRRWWALETTTVFADPGSDSLLVLPLFVAEIDPRAPVSLSSEHDAHRFVPARTAARLYLWEAQRRGLDAVRREVLRGGRLAAALEIAPARGHARRLPTPSRHRATSH